MQAIHRSSHWMNLQDPFKKMSGNLFGVPCDLRECRYQQFRWLTTSLQGLGLSVILAAHPFIHSPVSIHEVSMWPLGARFQEQDENFAYQIPVSLHHAWLRADTPNKKGGCKHSSSVGEFTVQKELLYPRKQLPLTKGGAGKHNPAPVFFFAMLCLAAALISPVLSGQTGHYSDKSDHIKWLLLITFLVIDLV